MSCCVHWLLFSCCFTFVCLFVPINVSEESLKKVLDWEGVPGDEERGGEGGK